MNPQMQQTPKALDPIDRVSFQLDFAKSKDRDMVAVSRTDLELLLARLHSHETHMYKGETPPA